MILSLAGVFSMKFNEIRPKVKYFSGDFLPCQGMWCSKHNDNFQHVKLKQDFFLLCFSSPCDHNSNNGQMLLPLTISMDISGLSRKSAMNDDVDANENGCNVIYRMIF